MITSSQFFKKTFFELEEDKSLCLLHKSTNQKSLNKNLTKKPITDRHSNINPPQSENIRNSTKSHTKNISSISNTKNHLKQNYNQIQLTTSHRKYHSSINHNDLEQYTLDVTPWNQHSSLTSRQLYDTKLTLNKQREKIKSMIQRYKWSKTIQEKDQQHANFIKSPKKNKKVNFMLYEYDSSKSKNNRKKPVNLIKNIDINKTYEQYLNHQIQLDKDFLFKSHTKVKNHNKKQTTPSKNCTSREGKTSNLIEKIPSRQQIENLLKKDLKCCQYLGDSRLQKRYQKLDTSISNQSSRDQENICHGGKISERKRVLQKAKHLKLQSNRKVFKGTKIALNAMVPPISLKKMNAQKISLQISGNKTRKLQYSFVSN